MANFEIRIYSISTDTMERIEKELNKPLYEWTDKLFVETAETEGDVYSLCTFLNLDVITPDTDVIRAYFVDTEHEEAEPIRADVYNTTFHADLIKHGEQVKYIEVKPTSLKEPVARTYTITITNTDTEISNDEIIQHVDNKIRLQVDTLGETTFNDIVNGIEDWLGLSVELIDEEQHF